VKIEGVIPPLLTPVEGRDGTISTEPLRSHVHFLENRGVHGLFPCGTTGEFPSLTRGEWRTTLETVTDAASVPVYAGCGATGVGEVVEQVQTAANVGADAAVVVTPYFLRTTQDGHQEFFEKVADRSPLPVVLYENPGYTGQNLSVETITALAAHDNIVGTKDSSGDLHKMNRYISATPDSFSVLQGSTIYSLASLDIGADGFVCGDGNVMPRPLTAMYDAYVNGDRERALSLMQEYELPLAVHHAEQSGDISDVPILKHLISIHGFDFGPPLPPLPTLSERQCDALEEMGKLLEAVEADPP